MDNPLSQLIKLIKILLTLGPEGHDRKVKIFTEYGSKYMDSKGKPLMHGWKR